MAGQRGRPRKEQVEETEVDVVGAMGEYDPREGGLVEDDNDLPTFAKRGRVRTPFTDNFKFPTPHHGPELVGRWINDDPERPGRIDAALNAGYEFWDKERGTVLKGKDGSTYDGTRLFMDVGNNVKAYYMVQRREWYEEDQLAKRKRIRDKTVNLNDNAKSEGFYGEFDVQT